jgi:hypothetical protein
MIPYLYVAAGGAIGSVGRYWVGLVTARAWGEAFPWGTILINIVGSVIIGFVSTLTLPSGPLGTRDRGSDSDAGMLNDGGTLSRVLPARNSVALARGIEAAQDGRPSNSSRRTPK